MKTVYWEGTTIPRTRRRWFICWQRFPRRGYIGFEWHYHDGNPSIEDPAAIYEKGDWTFVIGFGFLTIAYRSR